MEVYVVTRILKDKEGKEFLNQNVKVFGNIEDARALCEEQMELFDTDLATINHREIGVEMYEAKFNSVFGISSESYRIEKHEVK